MKKKEIELIKKGLDILHKEYGLEKYEEEIDSTTDKIYLPFPREDDLEIDLVSLFDYLKEIESLKIIDYNMVVTDTITQRVIQIGDTSKLLFLDHLEISIDKGIDIKIVEEPFLIGIAAVQKGEFDKYNPPCTSHIAIELRYETKVNRLPIDEEEKIIKSFLFEISHAYRTSAEFSTFHMYNFNYEDESYDLPNSFEDYNYGMELFIKANQPLSQDLKYLSYYKIFEFFAPIFSKLDAFDAMRKKLDSSNANSLSAEFISSIYELTKIYQENLRDKDLVKSIINNTFDLVDIFDELPASVVKNLSPKTLGYNSTKEVKDKIANQLGTILYQTRNKIVHAKSNFTPIGIECPDEDLEQLNVFMHKACYSTIKWYNKLPVHQKL
jgi:hypothetical protein